MKTYKSFELAKNGTNIPVFLSGRTMESRYNPERDALSLCNAVQEGFSFFLVLGIGSGIFIKKLSERFPKAKIVGVELDRDDIDFLRQAASVQELEKNDSIKLLALDELENFLSANYFPAKYGDMKIIEQRAWVTENKDYIDNINTVLKKTLGIISADFSVQAHFGKIWTSNILNNARLAERTKRDLLVNTNKTAVIVAAGPTLDKTISILKDRSNFYIISTDTAASTLFKKNIIPDAVISIDGQNVSYNHFIQNHSTLYAFDLCANFSAAKHISQAGHPTMFFCSGHPLSNAINASTGNHFPFLFSGAGTVTITAVDFAVQAGFEKIIILGADFSYSNGKAYASGTYLESLYNKESTKINSAEKLFSKLMFRTELKKINNDMTTQILEAYKTSLEKYLIDRDISFKKQNGVYSLTCNDFSKNKKSFYNNENINGFSLSEFYKKLNSSTPEETETLLLPYIAWLRNNKKYKNYSYSELLKLAFNTIVSYNI